MARAVVSRAVIATQSIAEAVKIQRETELLRAEARVKEERRALAAELDGLAEQITDDARRGPKEVEKMATAQRVSGELRRAATQLKDPASIGNEERVAAALQEKLNELEAGGAPEPWRLRLERIIGELRRVARSAVAESTFELYEFRMQDGQTTLVRVAGPESD